MRRDAPRPARTPGTTDHPIGSDDVLPYPRPREGLPPVTDAPRALGAAVVALPAGSAAVVVPAQRTSRRRYAHDAHPEQLPRQAAGTIPSDPLHTTTR